jgi:hypothetical protein
MTTDIAGYLRPLRKDEYHVVSYGDDTGSVAYRVRRATFFPLVYDPVKQGTLAGPMAPAGSAPTGTQVANFLDNQLLGLSSTVTSIAQVTDIFLFVKPYEMLQVWFGVAPRHLRVWPKQPYGQFVAVMDPNINPSASYPDVGFVHGFDSPFQRPSKATELTIPKNMSVNWALYNPGPWPINPRFNFFINRMFVEPVDDPQLALSLLTRRIPAHYTSVGNPENSVAYDSTAYGDVKPVTAAELQSKTQAEIIKLLRDKGYC